MAGVVKTDAVSAAGDGLLKWGGTRQKVDLLAEYPQIFRDVWRQIRDFFYDPGMHGRDWESVYAKYESLIRHVATRADMNYIIGHMIGELTASHEYIVGRGDPQRTVFFRVNTGLIGADLEPDENSGRYRFKDIIDASGWREDLRAPLNAPHIDIEEGDYLLGINDADIRTNENWLGRLENKAGKSITITVSREEPDSSAGKTYSIETLFSERGIRYYEETERRYRQVSEATGGRVGYMHLADMMDNGLMQFEQAFRAERYRDGLIIDVRGNGGGFVSWYLIDKLERVLTFITVTRDFNEMRYPHGARIGPVVVLCDEGTGSDGEVFTQHFKDLGLGTVIGKPTWGGLIGIINIIPLTDGGMVTQSNVGFANLRGDWIVENEGAIPDIEVDNDPAEVLKGRDQQLEKAIEIILEQIDSGPGTKLERPQFPVK
jgi:tricorn protease